MSREALGRRDSAERARGRLRVVRRRHAGARCAPIARRAATRSRALDAFDLFPNTPHVETVVVFHADRLRVRRLEEAFEQRPELAGAPEVLRVPLDAEAEARRRILDRLDDAVGRGRATREARRDAFTA